MRLLQLLLLLALLLPVAAAAEEPAQDLRAPDQASEGEPDRAWRPTMLRTLDLHGRPFGMAAGVWATVSANAYLGMAIQMAASDCTDIGCAPSGEAIVGLASLGLAIVPTAGVLPTIGLLRIALERTQLDPRRFRHRLAVSGGLLMLGGGITGPLALLFAYLHAYTYTGPPWGFDIAFASLTLVLLQAGASVLTLAEAGRRWEAKRRRLGSRRRPPPSLVAGPTGLILRF